jgi:hypothetical protein
VLGSYCLVAITSSDLEIIYNHDNNNDDATPTLSMFMLFMLLITKSYVNRNMENHPGKQTTILYGSGLG